MHDRSARKPFVAGAATIMSACLSIMVLAGAVPAKAQTAEASAEPADAIYVNANVLTMDKDTPRAEAIAVRRKKVVAVGRRADLQRFVGPDTERVDLDGATVIPGFIDPHSHFLGYASFANRTFWTDVSSVNLYFKPHPKDQRCRTPDDPQQCFIPVQTHEDVAARLAAVVDDPKTTGAYGAAYDPARLGHGPTCAGSDARVGFQCPNFENGQARKMLDELSRTKPIFVSSQSGHISYANTVALKELNICGTNVATVNCYMPTINPSQEMRLAQLGQLNEDVALYADSFYTAKSFRETPLAAAGAILLASDIFAGHGFTLVQEGAATVTDAQIYLDIMRADPSALPFTVALMMYDATAAKFQPTIRAAKQTEALIDAVPRPVADKIFVAGVKSFADGSPNGYTAFLSQPYQHVYEPFTRAYFPQPYVGLPDLRKDELRERTLMAHRGGYPLMVHQNGDRAIEDSIKGFEEAQKASPSRFRDISLHVPYVSESNLQRLKDLGNPVSFLMQHIYFWGLPECQQILGARYTQKIFAPYPFATASRLGVKLTLHTDSPVTPPDPLFTIWVGVTRNVQQPTWIPNRDPDRCPTVNNPQEAMTIEQGLRAYTIDAAYQYGLEGERGSITPGKLADFAILSEDPLAMEKTPDRLRTVRVLGTVHQGTFRANPAAALPPIWPE